MSAINLSPDLTAWAADQARRRGLPDATAYVADVLGRERRCAGGDAESDPPPARPSADTPEPTPAFAGGQNATGALRRLEAANWEPAVLAEVAADPSATEAERRAAELILRMRSAGWNGLTFEEIAESSRSEI